MLKQRKIVCSPHLKRQISKADECMTYENPLTTTNTPVYGTFFIHKSGICLQNCTSDAKILYSLFDVAKSEAKRNRNTKGWGGSTFTVSDIKNGTVATETVIVLNDCILPKTYRNKLMAGYLHHEDTHAYFSRKMGRSGIDASNKDIYFSSLEEAAAFAVQELFLEKNNLAFSIDLKYYQEKNINPKKLVRCKDLAKKAIRKYGTDTVKIIAKDAMMEEYAKLWKRNKTLCPSRVNDAVVKLFEDKLKNYQAALNYFFNQPVFSVSYGARDLEVKI